MSPQLDSATSAPSPVWVFPESLQQLLGDGEADFLAEIIELYKSQTRGRMRLLRAAVDNGRWEEARAQAHAIKGGSSQVGADRLAVVCSEIETGAESAATGSALVSEAEFLFEEACRLIGLPPAGVDGAAG
jgi:HPt (histidine-containing phosphotransfer) domain-containing protein